MKRRFLYLIPILIVCGCTTPSTLRTGAFEGDAWKHSCWISAKDAPVVTGAASGKNIRSADGASWFVATYRNDKKLVSAEWMTTGLGVYDIYVNGRLVGDEVLKPGFTHPEKTKVSFTYDITNLLDRRQGRTNQLSAQVTPGWWADKIVTHNSHEGMVGRKCAFRSVLKLTYADGNIVYHGTDTMAWKAGIAGPVKHAGIFDGETYDARHLPGYAAADGLDTPELNKEFSGEIIPSMGAEVYWRRDLALKPVEIYSWKGVDNESEEEFGKVKIVNTFKPDQTIHLNPGETLVVDFGQNASAVPSFEFKAEEGTLLTCLPSEILNDGNGAKNRGMDGPEGSCHRMNLRTQDEHMRLEYIFARCKRYVQYTPRCTFFGYRYVSITATGPVEFKSIVSVPVTSITPEMETGHITTGNPLINQLISNTRWGMISNYLSVPTDCPQRNERLGWTADTQAFAETGTFFADTETFLRKWLRDVRDTQLSSGAYRSVAPKAMGGTSKMRCGWADAGIIVPWIIWKQFGKTDVIQEHWSSMESFMDHLDQTKYDHTALIKENGNYQFADWLSFEPLESFSRRSHQVGQDGKSEPRPEAIEYWTFLSQSYWLIDAGMMRDMAAATGRDVAKYESQMDQARTLLKGFLNEDGSFKTEILNTMQTPALFALKNRLLDGQAKENMIARLRNNFAQHGGCLQTGFLGTSILMSTLTENGMVDIAYDLLFQRKNPSWLYSIDNGATTIWERWDSYTKEKGMGPQSMNSFNHYAYGCVCEWIWETAAGISCNPDGCGFRHLILKPFPDKRLGSIDAEYKTPYGTVKSAWKYKGDKWIWKFTIPEGICASVTLPGETDSKEYQAGTYRLEKQSNKI